VKPRHAIVFAAATLLWLTPQAAFAHGTLQGVGDFYAGLLHPVIVPAELLAIVASGLLIGRSGLVACQRGIPAFAGAVAAGLVLAFAFAAAADMTTPLVSAALVAAAIVTTGLRPPIWTAVGLASLAGLAVGFDAAPEANARLGALLSGMATVLASTALITIVAALALQTEKHWQRIAAQIAGSWITASAVLYLTFQFVAQTR
jgi:hydrogenase/urease accessory protein HupE